jgi:hypothetical protein
MNTTSLWVTHTRYWSKTVYLIKGSFFDSVHCGLPKEDEHWTPEPLLNMWNCILPCVYSSEWVDSQWHPSLVCPRRLNFMIVGKFKFLREAQKWMEEVYHTLISKGIFVILTPQRNIKTHIHTKFIWECWNIHTRGKHICFLAEYLSTVAICHVINCDSFSISLLSVLPQGVVNRE